MKIALGADHAGFALKQQLVKHLADAGHEVMDFGTTSEASADYPDFAGHVATAVASGGADRGILVCSTGVGMAIAANKVPGVRAAVAMNDDEVELTRAHNDANVLTIGSRYTDPATAAVMVKLFLETPFEGGRHARRLDKIAELERRNET